MKSRIACSSLVRCARASGHATAPTINAVSFAYLYTLRTALRMRCKSRSVAASFRVAPGPFPCLAMPSLAPSESDKGPLLFSIKITMIRSVKSLTHLLRFGPHDPPYRVVCWQEGFDARRDHQ